MKTELPALVALEAIGECWFDDRHRCDLMALALVSQQLAKEGSDIQAASIMLAAQLEIDPLRKEDVRHSVVTINTWLQRQSNGRIQSAIDKLFATISKKAPARKYG